MNDCTLKLCSDIIRSIVRCLRKKIELLIHSLDTNLLLIVGHYHHPLKNVFTRAISKVGKNHIHLDKEKTSVMKVVDLTHDDIFLILIVT